MHILGKTCLYSLTACYLYYTVWIMVMPLIDEDHAAHNYFLDRKLGLTVTTLLAYMLISLIFTMSGCILVRGEAVSQKEVEKAKKGVFATTSPHLST